MKVLLSLLFLVFSFVAKSADYYFSQVTGNDMNLGTIGSPFQSLAKAQTLTIAGNRLYFQRGNVWYGSLTMQGSGTSGTRIFIGAYGTGEKPVITGLSLISAWDSPVSNVYTSTAAASTLSTCNIASINNTNYSQARMPKSGVYTITGTNGSTTISNASISSSIVSANNGSRAAIRVLMYQIETEPITNIAGNTITFTAPNNGVNTGWGVVLLNDVKMASQANEWVYNTSTKKFSVYSSTGVPTNVQIPTIEEGVNCNNRQYITFDNINFKGYNSTGINTTAQQGISITNCDFSFIGGNGIYAYGNSPNLIVTGCTFTDCNSRAIHAGASSNAIITNNILNRIGFFTGMGGNQDSDYTGIVADGDNTTCSYNNISNIGFNGIHLDGNSTVVSYNYINTTNFVKDDGAGIYGFPTQCSPPNSPCTQPTRYIMYNTVLNAIGAPDGSTEGSQAAGIYLDGQFANVVVMNNTVGNTTVNPLGAYGIFLNGNRFVTVKNNLVYNFKQGLYMTRITTNGGSLKNDTIINNIFCTPQNNAAVACDNRRVPVEYIFDSTVIPVGFYAANNIYANPLDQTRDYIHGTFSTNLCYNVASWKVASGTDNGTTSSPLIVASINDVVFLSNSTAGSVTTSVGSSLIDLSNTSYASGIITLPAYTGGVYLKNGSANTPPTANAGSDVTITLPINFCTLNGSGASTTGGSITSYAWTQISGTAATIASPSSATTQITGLTAGTRVFRLSVVDNNGLSASDDVTVTTNAALVIPTANAGANQVITLPTSTVALSGSGSGGTINSYLWTKLVGLGGTFSAATSANTNFSGLSSGIYSVELMVGNTAGNFGRDTMTVTVYNAPTAPTCNAGTTPVSITLPTSTVGLSATGASTSGNTVSFLWTLFSGSGGTITSPTSQSTTATGLGAGNYTYRILVTDNVNGLTCTSDKLVTVNTASVPPTVTGGADQTITLPTSTSSVSATAIPSTGSITAILWSIVASPGGSSAAITTPTSLTTGITNITVAGTYFIKILVTQTGGLQAADTVRIFVNPVGSQTIPGIRAFGINFNTNTNKLDMVLTTDEPLNMAYFYLQKLVNTSFRDIGSKITATSSKTYKTNDAMPASGATVTYRVKGVTRNNVTHYSQSIQLKKN